MIKSAYISEDGKYRYHLQRIWSQTAYSRCCFIMLNPSTADAFVDDPTIRRCMGFAKSLNFGSMGVVNLFAYRTSKPTELFKSSDPVGPENDEVILSEVHRADCHLVIAAWGSNGGKYLDRVKTVCHGIKKGLMCFGTTQLGQPRHPLYLPANSELEEYFIP